MQRYPDLVVSVLFNEPKLLKFLQRRHNTSFSFSFSALQRAEIAEIKASGVRARDLQMRFSALQRAEIAEIGSAKSIRASTHLRFSALQRAEIAEMRQFGSMSCSLTPFQCSSTSRNC